MSLKISIDPSSKLGESLKCHGLTGTSLANVAAARFLTPNSNELSPRSLQSVHTDGVPPDVSVHFRKSSDGFEVTLIRPTDVRPDIQQLWKNINEYDPDQSKTWAGVQRHLQDIIELLKTDTSELDSPTQACVNCIRRTLGLYYLYSCLRPYKAEPHFKAALQVTKALYEGPNSATITALEDLGALLWKWRPDQAKEHYTQALDDKIQLYGEDCLEAASTLDRLGEIAAFKGESRQANQYFQQALAIRKKHGRDQEISLKNLAEQKWTAGELQAARKFLKQLQNKLKAIGGVSIKQELVGIEAEAVFEFHRGCWEDDDSSIEKALKLMEQAIKLRSDWNGKSHPDFAQATGFAGNILDENLRRPAEARSYFEQTLKVLSEGPARGSSTTGAAETVLGVFLSEQQLFKEALPHLKSALKITRDLFDAGESEALEVIHALGALGVLHIDLDNPEKAKELFKEALNIVEKNTSESWVKEKQTDAWIGLGRAEFRSGNYQAAEQYCEKALPHIEAAKETWEANPEKMMEWVGLLDHMAIAYYKSGNHKRADDLLHKSTRCKIDGCDVTLQHVIASLSEMAKLFEITGETARQNFVISVRQELEQIDDEYEGCLGYADKAQMEAICLLTALDDEPRFYDFDEASKELRKLIRQ